MSEYQFYKLFTTKNYIFNCNQQLYIKVDQVCHSKAVLILDGLAHTL